MEGVSLIVSRKLPGEATSNALVMKVTTIINGIAASSRLVRNVVIFGVGGQGLGVGLNTSTHPPTLTPNFTSSHRSLRSSKWREAEARQDGGFQTCFCKQPPRA